MKYAVNFGDCSDFTAEDLTFDYGSDGVHINGPARGGVVRGIRGFTGDDTVSVTPNDYTGANDVYGDVSQLLIEDIAPYLSKSNAVKVLGGSASPLTSARNITVRDIGGYATQEDLGFGGLVNIGDDTGMASTTGGLIDKVLVQNVYGTVPDAVSVVHINAKNIGQVEVDGVNYDNASGTAAAVGIGPGAGGSVGAITLKNLRVKNLGAAAVVSVGGSTQVGRLTVDGLTVESWAGSTTAPLIWLSKGPAHVSVRHVKVLSSAGGAVVQADDAATLTIVCQHIRLANSSNSIQVVRVAQPVTIADVIISDTVGVVTGGSIVNLSSWSGGVGAGITRLTVTGTNWSGSGGFVQTTANAGHPPMTLLAQGCTLIGTGWGIGDIAHTLTARMSNVIATPSANIANLRASAVLVVYAANCDFNGKTFQGTAGYTVASRGFGLPVDISVLNSKTKGDAAYNTNAALSCGVGQVVYTGTAWKSLIDGTTY